MGGRGGEGMIFFVSSLSFFLFFAIGFQVGEDVAIPTYDFTKHSRTHVTESVLARPIVLVEVLAISYHVSSDFYASRFSLLTFSSSSSSSSLFFFYISIFKSTLRFKH